jgi:hypothetical protein
VHATGEKARVALAIFALVPRNLLLLDEVRLSFSLLLLFLLVLYARIYIHVHTLSVWMFAYTMCARREAQHSTVSLSAVRVLAQLCTCMHTCKRVHNVYTAFVCGALCTGRLLQQLARCSTSIPIHSPCRRCYML